MWEKCKPWILQNFPDLYPNLQEGATGKWYDLLIHKFLEETKGGHRGGKGIVKPEKDEVKLPGGKVKPKVLPSFPLILIIRKIQKSNFQKHREIKRST
jgi:hypothetical protein